MSNRTVRLQWADSPSVKGPVYIYRSREPFSGRGAQYQARSTEVPYGRQSFVEEVEALGMWYYLIMASDETRMKYEMVVPFNNVVDVQLDGSTKTITAGGSVAGSTPYVDQAIISQPALRAAEDPTWDSTHGSYGVARQNGYSSYSNDIVNLTAQVLPNGIYISFRSSEQNKNALLYRSNRPITHFNDLMTAVVIKDYLTAPYIDYPPAGGPY
jgi:hypothetical protein